MQGKARAETLKQAEELINRSENNATESDQDKKPKQKGNNIFERSSNVSGIMVYSHWLSPGLGPEPGIMVCMVSRRTFHTAPEQEQGPEQGYGRMGYV